MASGRRRSVSGVDGSGKSETINLLYSWMDPRHIQAHAMDAPSADDTEVLEERLLEQGFEVRIARTAAQAKKLLEASEIDVVLSEIDLDRPDGGLLLRETALKEGFARESTWVILTAKTDRASQLPMSTPPEPP